jgi:hypothetical protein
VAGGPSSVASPSRLDDDVLGAFVGSRPVRDRSMRPEAERLLREWFTAPDAGSGHGDPVPDPVPDPDADQPSRAAAGATWSAPLRDLVSAVAAVRAQVPVELPGPQAVAEAEVLLSSSRSCARSC